MSEIIEKTYKLLDVLDNSEVIKKLTKYKEKLQQDEEVLSLVKKINNEDNSEIKIALRKKLYSNSDYQKYMESLPAELRQYTFRDFRKRFFNKH